MSVRQYQVSNGPQGKIRWTLEDQINARKRKIEVMPWVETKPSFNPSRPYRFERIHIVSLSGRLTTPEETLRSLALGEFAEDLFSLKLCAFMRQQHTHGWVGCWEREATASYSRKARAIAHAARLRRLNRLNQALHPNIVLPTIKRRPKNQRRLSEWEIQTMAAMERDENPD